MNIFSRFKRLFKRDKFPKNIGRIVEAFTANGITYFQFEDINKASCQRALQAWTYINELSMRVDREYLEKHVEAVDKILDQFEKGGQIRVFLLKEYNTQLKDRLKWIVDTDIVYKLASVVYFDETENPQEYDFQYNHKKIDSWKKSLSVSDFFYSAPILQLVPWLENTQINLDEYSKMTLAIKAHEQASLEKATLN